MFLHWWLHPWKPHQAPEPALSPANLILLPFLSDVSWLRGVDKRLCDSLAVKITAPAQGSFPLCATYSHSWKVEQRDLLLISKWLARGELLLCGVLQFVLHTEHWHGTFVLAWMQNTGVSVHASDDRRAQNTQLSNKVTAVHAMDICTSFTNRSGIILMPTNMTVQCCCVQYSEL